MTAPIDFYFDFSSPYAYIAIQQIEALAAKHGRSVNWQPILIGVIFKNLGSMPLVEYPLKGAYSRHDFARSARFVGIPFNMPTAFPINTVNAARAALWIKTHLPQHLSEFVRAVSRAYFVDNQPINDIAVIHGIAAALGLDADAVCEGLSEPAIKDGLRANTEAAQARGVFGAPFIFVDNEPFWGNDRLAQIDRWLGHGSF